jgi:hypothetical protein
MGRLEPVNFSHLAIHLCQKHIVPVFEEKSSLEIE